MFGICGILVAIERHYHSRFFRWFPSIVLVMFASMALYTAGAWEMTDDIRAARATVRDNLIPAMLFLMSLRFNLVVIRRLGARLIALCLASTVSIMIGFIVVHELMKRFLGDETPLTFATMSAGWTGGTQNFVAVKEALSVTDAAMTYTLLMGALCYSVWLVVIIALKPFKERFASLLRADDSGLTEVLDEIGDIGVSEPVDTSSLMLMLGLSLIAASVSNHLGSALAGAGLLNPMIWAIIVSSALGMIAAPGDAVCDRCIDWCRGEPGCNCRGADVHPVGIHDPCSSRCLAFVGGAGSENEPAPGRHRVDRQYWQRAVGGGRRRRVRQEPGPRRNHHGTDWFDDRIVRRPDGVRNPAVVQHQVSPLRPLIVNSGIKKGD
jgi:hypothetical protein